MTLIASLNLNKLSVEFSAMAEAELVEAGTALKSLVAAGNAMAAPALTRAREIYRARFSMETVTCECTRCFGTGEYVWGTIVNGVPSFRGVCFRCWGSGREVIGHKAKAIVEAPLMATKAEAYMEVEAPAEIVAVPDGTFTVVLGPDGEYITVRVETKPEGSTMAGKRIFSKLVGSDNERDFVGLGFVDSMNALKLWKKHEGTNGRAVAAWAIVAGAENVGEYQEAYAIKSGRCSKCGRTLTVPASLHRGMGPDCAAKAA